MERLATGVLRARRFTGEVYVRAFAAQPGCLIPPHRCGEVRRGFTFDLLPPALIGLGLAKLGRENESLGVGVESRSLCDPWRVAVGGRPDLGLHLLSSSGAARRRH